MRTRFGGALLCGALVGCTSTPASNDGGADAAVEAQVEAAVDAGTSGTLIVWSGVYGGGLTNLVFDNFTVDPSARCGAKKDGACWVIDCTSAGPAPTSIASGTVELYSGATSLLSINPLPSGYYGFASKTSALWSGGDAIGLRSAGAALPKFDVPLTGPSAIAITDPAPDAGILTIDRATGFTASWSGASGKVIIAISQVATGATDLTASLRLICEYDGAAGTGAVPSSASSILSTSAPTTSVNIGGASIADITSGSYPIHAYALDAETWSATVQ